MRNWNSLNFRSWEWNWQQRQIKWKQYTATLPVPWSSHALERRLSNLFIRAIDKPIVQPIVRIYNIFIRSNGLPVRSKILLIRSNG